MNVCSAESPMVARNPPVVWALVLALVHVALVSEINSKFWPPGPVRVRSTAGDSPPSGQPAPHTRRSAAAHREMCRTSYDSAKT